MWKKAGLAAALVVALAVPAAVHAVRAAPPALPPRPATFKPGQTFTPVCKASEILDSRPDPAWVGASFAGDNCRAPALPMPLNGASATRAQIVAAMAAAKRYAVLSDAYQKCIADFVAARKARSAATQANTPLFVIENHRILVSQENSRKARRQMDAAMMPSTNMAANVPVNKPAAPQRFVCGCEGHSFITVAALRGACKPWRKEEKGCTTPAGEDICEILGLGCFSSVPAWPPCWPLAARSLRRTRA